MALFKFKKKEDPLDLGMPPPDMPPEGAPSPQQNFPNQQMQPEFSPQNYEAHYQQQFPQMPAQQQQPSLDEERIEEITEAIIDEKWDEFSNDIKKVIDWKEKSEDRIAKAEQQILDIKMSIDSLTKGIMSKISAYDQNIMDVGTEVKAMEKVFQKVLPSLTESVNKLDRMSKTPSKDKLPKI